MCASGGLRSAAGRGRGALSAVPLGAPAVRGAAAAAQTAHPHPSLGAAGARLPGSARDSPPGGRAGCEAGMRVALSCPSSLPLLARRCPPGAVDSMLARARPLLSPERWQGLPRSRRGEGALPGRAGLPGGLRGAFPSHARLCLTPLCRPAPGVAGAARPRLPCPGWECLIPYLRELGF